MGGTRVQRWLSLVATGAAVLLAAPAAHAGLDWDRTSFDFGSHAVGTSAVQTFTLTATCDFGFPVCISPPGGTHAFGMPAATGSGFAIDSTGPNTCEGGLLSTPLDTGSASCQSTVRFAPTAAGATSGSLVLPTGPDVALTGSSPQPPAAASPGGTKPKKCKKRKKGSAGAAKKKKKCRKKKR